ncbi:Endo-1-3(4)-beta-glucanase [Penicillium capsulatum]|uniref:Endo-1-3(4)-beta-glucanase n=1 Tax=Penicillium capsulatum TaxID=69766 RepID=A0A9W9I3A2_9EURO|nr:Endo-1-3(4)-beta-glucanase [Penicillium capsulatum]KAJ6108822.1 Endo-1-3(4)-beta-glucanase [Penicillium capsulatum]
MRESILSWATWGIAAIGCAALVSSAADSPAAISTHPPDKIDPRDCDCFTVSGPDPGYFQHYKLWDFRAVPMRKHPHTFPLRPFDPNDLDEDDIDDSDDGDNNVDEYEHEEDKTNEPSSSSLFFFETPFHKDWVSQQWRRTRTPAAPVAMVNSKRNVFFTRNRDRPGTDATHLVLRTTRFSNYTSTAEIETRIRDIYRCSLRVRLRIIPAKILVAQPSSGSNWPPEDPSRHPVPALNDTRVGNHTSPGNGKPVSGACVGIFTYRTQNCESDIEILTSDPLNRVRYANQPDYDPVTDQTIPGASTVADLPVLWTSWSTHRLDWHADRSRWYVGNILQDSKSYRVPNLASRLVINLWSDGGVWTGDMKLGETVYVGIEYIELAYNRSSDRPRGRTIPPELRHGGHQIPIANMSMLDPEGADDHAFSPATEIVTGARKGKKCKKGRKGRKCRKKQKDKDKDDQGFCRRPCNVDSLLFAQPR